MTYVLYKFARRIPRPMLLVILIVLLTAVARA